MKKNKIYKKINLFDIYVTLEYKITYISIYSVSIKKLEETIREQHYVKEYSDEKLSPRDEAEIVDLLNQEIANKINQKIKQRAKEKWSVMSIERNVITSGPIKKEYYIEKKK